MADFAEGFLLRLVKCLVTNAPNDGGDVAIGEGDVLRNDRPEYREVAIHPTDLATGAAVSTGNGKLASAFMETKEAERHSVATSGSRDSNLECVCEGCVDGSWIVFRHGYSMRVGGCSRPWGTAVVSVGFGVVSS